MAEAKKPDAEPKDVAVTEGEDEKTPTSWLAWTLGWVVAPGSIVFAIWFAGLLIGVHFYDSWFVRAIMWIASWFIEV